jgi:hypothetical protein
MAQAEHRKAGIVPKPSHAVLGKQAKKTAPETGAVENRHCGGQGGD